jgi:hypothetical protein
VPANSRPMPLEAPVMIVTLSWNVGSRMIPVI